MLIILITRQIYMNNILVTGGNGQLGSELREIALNDTYYSFFFTDLSNLDITNYKSVTDFIKINKIDVIINCAAYTNVDKAEAESELADAINHLAVANFAKIAKDREIKLIHISTDYVFDGKNNKPYLESDLPNPQSVYGRTKLAGELAIQKISPLNSIIIRTSWLYSSYGNNFIKTMLRLSRERDDLSVRVDQLGTPTYARDLAKAIIKSISHLENDEVEIYHFSNNGFCSLYDFAKAIFDFYQIDMKLIPIETKLYPTAAKRPLYSIMNKSKIIEKYNLTITHWKDSLLDCLEKIKK